VQVQVGQGWLPWVRMLQVRGWQQPWVQVVVVVVMSLRMVMP
jgi:hypothetical protein